MTDVRKTSDLRQLKSDLWPRGHSSVGRAPALQAGGRRFDPVWLHQTVGRRRQHRKQVTAKLVR